MSGGRLTLRPCMLACMFACLSHLVRGAGGARQGGGAAVDGARVPQDQITRSGSRQHLGVWVLQTGEVARDLQVVVVIAGMCIHEVVVGVMTAGDAAEASCFFRHICQGYQTLNALHASQRPALVHMHPPTAGALMLQAFSLRNRKCV